VSESKRRAIAALLTSKTRKEAAEKAGISDRTLRTYFSDPEFVRAYKEAFSGIIEEATREAQRAISPALAVLREIMEDQEQQAPARISAARATLEYGMKMTETLDILEQLNELEAWRREADGGR
jgi:hypothetical protein